MNLKVLICAAALLPVAARAQDAMQPVTPDAAQPSATPSTTSEIKPVPQATAAAPLPDKILLRLRLQPGQAFELRMTTNLKQTQIVQGQKLNIEGTTQIGARYDVQSVVPDGTAQIKLTYTDLSSTQGVIGADGKHTDINAALPRRGKLRQNFQKMLQGQSLTMTMAPDGRVTQVRGMSQLMNRLLASLPTKTAADRQALDAVRKLFSQMFSEKNLQQMMGQATTGQYPPNALGIGESWTQKTAFDLGFPISMQTRNTLVARAGGISTVNQTGTLRMGGAGNASKDALIIGPASMTMNLAGTLKGSSRIDEGSGFARYARTSMRIGGRVQVRVNGKTKPGEPREISFPLYQLSTTVVTTQPIITPATLSAPTPATPTMVPGIMVR